MGIVNLQNWLLCLGFSCYLKHPVIHNEKEECYIFLMIRTRGIFTLGATKLLFSSQGKHFYVNVNHVDDKSKSSQHLPC